jgi:methylated-DNA-[protein]-cysteine S-methyltransferase
MRRIGSMKNVDVEERAAAASRALARAAREAGLEDVAYATVDTPVGLLLVAATRRGLVRLAFPEEILDHVLEELADTVSPRVLEDPSSLDEVRRQLDEYFEEKRRRFDLGVDLRLIGAGFSRRVLDATARIPYGSVSTYRDMASKAGSPRAARAAGNALHDNPVPIVVPCHRVVPSSGGIGRYGGNEWRKEFLLGLEGALEDQGQPR